MNISFLNKLLTWSVLFTPACESSSIYIQNLSSQWLGNCVFTLHNQQGQTASAQGFDLSNLGDKKVYLNIRTGFIPTSADFYLVTLLCNDAQQQLHLMYSDINNNIFSVYLPNPSAAGNVLVYAPPSDQGVAYFMVYPPNPPCPDNQGLPLRYFFRDRFGYMGSNSYQILF